MKARYHVHQYGVRRIRELVGGNQIAGTSQKLMIAAKIRRQTILEVVVELFRQPSSRVAKFGHVFVILWCLNKLFSNRKNMEQAINTVAVLLPVLPGNGHI
ncbi:hypothetical protein [Klebsiella pneumoniae]|uniref:hypothetical protein n=1 Tax=Klebsiella pneumoniae TaxID=573 RepID=UPI0015F2C338|nr:hypothetical protein [Klebsiella pneumoniae]